MPSYGHESPNSNSRAVPLSLDRTCASSSLTARLCSAPAALLCRGDSDITTDPDPRQACAAPPRDTLAPARQAE